MRVLIFTPYTDQGTDKPGGFLGIWPRTLEAIMAIQAPPGTVDRMLVTECRWDWRTNIVEAYRKGRRVLLAGDYDALLTVEADNVPPPDTLTKLLSVPEAGIVYGLGVLRQGPHPAYSALQYGGRNVGSPMRSEDLRKTWGQPIEVSGISFQTTLFYRSVLKQFDFEHPDPTTFSADHLIALRCLQAGIRQACHTGVIVGHIIPSGVTLWPTPEGIREDHDDKS